jgi:hypothetical protein
VVDWNAIGAIGEMLGAVAVVITLLYLSKQIRQNTRSVQIAVNSLIGSIRSVEKRPPISSRHDGPST